MMIVFPICPICGKDITIKDTERFSSALCEGHRIIIYYYDTGIHCEIGIDEYLKYKRRAYGKK